MEKEQEDSEKEVEEAREEKAEEEDFGCRRHQREWAEELLEWVLLEEVKDRKLVQCTFMSDA